MYYGALVWIILLEEKENDPGLVTTVFSLEESVYVLLEQPVRGVVLSCLPIHI
jgi:hypothetical protein